MTDITRSPIGRPSTVTDEKIKRLEEAFMYGFSDNMACVYAGVSRTAFYRFLTNNEPLRDRFKALKGNVRLQARFNIAKAIEAGDLEVSKWYLERRDRLFRKKVKVQAEVADVIIDEAEIRRQLEQLIKRVSV